MPDMTFTTQLKALYDGLEDGETLPLVVMNNTVILSQGPDQQIRVLDTWAADPATAPVDVSQILVFDNVTLPCRPIQPEPGSELTRLVSDDGRFSIYTDASAATNLTIGPNVTFDQLVLLQEFDDGEECTCPAEWFPHGVCDTFCSNATTCSNNGVCNENGTCVCDAGTVGASCMLAVAPHSAVALSTAVIISLVTFGVATYIAISFGIVGCMAAAGKSASSTVRRVHTRVVQTGTRGDDDISDMHFRAL